MPLNDEIEENLLIENLIGVWNDLKNFQELYREELTISKRAYDPLMQLANIRDIKETELLGRRYTLDFSAIVNYKTGKRQAFQLYDADQMITRGFLLYLDHHYKNTPFQTIAVQLEGYNHIFTSSREILGENQKEWWITKLFATQNLNNSEIMARAMRLLTEHNIEVKDSTYFVGTYDNETRSFVEGAHQVK